MDELPEPVDEPGEHHFLLGATSVGVVDGDVHGVHSGVINGDVTQHHHHAEKVQLVSLHRTNEEIRVAQEHFVEPGNYSAARRVLAERNILVLCGRGSGRSYAARRLLADLGAESINEVNRQRELHSFRHNELVRGHGYVLTVSELSAAAFSGWEFEQCESVLRAEGCRLVIVLDHKAQVASAATACTVLLTAPDPDEVALSEIRRLRPESGEEPMMVVKNHLHGELEPGAPPEKAVRAAELAISVADGVLEVDAALAELRERVDDAVAAWFDERDLYESSLALAIAAMENRPYSLVVEYADRLDESLRKAELPEDKALRPRRVFAKSRQQLLRDLCCEQVRRDHPWLPGLHEETVRFSREGWAAAALRYIWREYPSVHQVLHEWVEKLPINSAQEVLSRVIADVPAHDPLRPVRVLAHKSSIKSREIAAGTLNRLANRYGLETLVGNSLRSWVEYGGARAKWTAAAVYSSSYGRNDLTESLARLGELGRSEAPTAQDGVIGGILRLMTHHENREAVVDTVLAWSEPQYWKTGLRPVSLSLALWFAGFIRSDRGVADYAAPFDRQLRQLVRRTLQDPEYGELAIERLNHLVLRSRRDEEAARELIRLLNLCVPDLSWRSRRRYVADLTDLHRSWRHEIPRIFRTVRRLEQQEQPNRMARSGRMLLSCRSMIRRWVRSDRHLTGGGGGRRSRGG